MPESALGGDTTAPTPVREARVSDATRIDNGDDHPDTLALVAAGTVGDNVVEAMIIDGNRDEGVIAQEIRAATAGFL